MSLPRLLFKLFILVLFIGCSTNSNDIKPKDTQINPDKIELVKRLPLFGMPYEPVHYAVEDNRYWYVLKADMLFVIAKEADGSHKLAGSLYIPKLHMGSFGHYLMAVDNNYIYIGRDHDILIVSISDPSNPRLIGEFGDFKHLGAINVINNFLFVSDIRILNVYTIVNPESPALVAKHDFGGWVYSVSYGIDAYYISSNSDTVCFNFTPDMQIKILDVLSSKWNNCSHAVDGDKVLLMDHDGVRMYKYSPSTHSHDLMGSISIDAAYLTSIYYKDSFLLFSSIPRFAYKKSKGEKPTVINSHEETGINLSIPHDMKILSEISIPGIKFFTGIGNEILITGDEYSYFASISEDNNIHIGDRLEFPGEIMGSAIIENQLYVSGKRLYRIPLPDEKPSPDNYSSATIPWYWGYSYSGNILTDFEKKLVMFGPILYVWKINSLNKVEEYTITFKTKTSFYSAFLYKGSIFLTSFNDKKPGIFIESVPDILQSNTWSRDNFILHPLTDEPTWGIAVHNGFAYSISKIGNETQIVVSEFQNGEWLYSIQRINIPEHSYKLKCMDNYLIVEDIDYGSSKREDSSVYIIQQDGKLSPAGLKIPNGSIYGIHNNYLYVSEGSGFYIASMDNPLIHLAKIETGYGINRFTFYKNLLLLSTDGGLFIYN